MAHDSPWRPPSSRRIGPALMRRPAAHCDPKAAESAASARRGRPAVTLEHIKRVGWHLILARTSGRRPAMPLLHISMRAGKLEACRHVFVTVLEAARENWSASRDPA